jgi:hypothetical protein
MWKNKDGKDIKKKTATSRHRGGAFMQPNATVELR